MGIRLPRFSCLVVFFCFLAIISFGQQVSSRPLITQPVVESELTTLKGNTHPLAQPQFDIGAAPPDLPMSRMLLVLKRNPEQEHSLRTLLDNQQDKASSHYHKWLTPNQFGTQFGPADNDVQVVTGWLQSLTTTPGGGGSLQIFVAGQSNYAGTINFSASSCSGMPSESTCSFSPASVAGAGNTGLAVNTIAPHPLAANRKPLGEDLWATALGTPLAAFLLIALPRRRTWRSLGSLLLVAMFCVCLSCGGGGGGGGGGTRTDPGTPPGSYTITVTATSGSGSTAITHTTTFTLVVQ